MNFSIKSARDRALETLLVLAFVLLFFLALLALLNALFPTGQSLLGLVRPGNPVRSPVGDQLAPRKLLLSAGTGESGLGEEAAFAAVLMNLDNQVKSKRADQIAWGGASKGMTFKEKDAIQTFENSSATLSFTKGDYLQLEENSLVVIREMEGDVFTREHRTVVVLMGGQLTGRVSKTSREMHNLEVVAPGAAARVPSRATGDRPSRFRMTVNPDNTSVLTVLEGTADLEVDGKTILVGADQVVKIRPGKPLVYLGAPAGPPLLTSPAHDATFSFREVPPEVTFRWKGRAGSGDYHFVLASDPGFRKVVHEERIENDLFVHGNLDAGDYYWRVRSMSEDGQGSYSRARHFSLVQDLEPPALVVDYPDTGVEGDRFQLRGTTDPGARVFVGGMPVRVGDSGDFTHDLFLQRGFNVIVVEAVDEVGNVAYFSRVINVEF